MVAHRYWDACCFLGWLKEEPDKIVQCEAGIRQAERGDLVIVTSTISLAEVLYLAKKERPISKATRDKIQSFFQNDYILLLEVDRRTAERAQEVVWDYEVKPKDAIHVATALIAGERLAIEQLDTYDGPLIETASKIDGLRVGNPSFPTDLFSAAAEAVLAETGRQPPTPPPQSAA